MADTTRTLSAALALVDTTGAGGTSGQDVRDCLVSVFGNYAELRAIAASGHTTISTPGKYNKWTANGPANGCVTPDYLTNSRITVSVDGVYKVEFSGRIKGTAATATPKAEIRKNGGGSAEGCLASASLTARTNDYVNLGFSGLVTLAASDYVELFVSSAISCALTADFASLSVVKVG